VQPGAEASLHPKRGSGVLSFQYSLLLSCAPPGDLLRYVDAGRLRVLASCCSLHRCVAETLRAGGAVGHLRGAPHRAVASEGLVLETPYAPQQLRHANETSLSRRRVKKIGDGHAAVEILICLALLALQVQGAVVGEALGFERRVDDGASDFPSFGCALSLTDPTSS